MDSARNFSQTGNFLLRAAEGYIFALITGPPGGLNITDPELLLHHQQGMRGNQHTKQLNSFLESGNLEFKQRVAQNIIPGHTE